MNQTTNLTEKHFGIIDYSMLVVTVAVSIGIGVYHGIRGNKTAEDFAMGSRSMNPLPVSLSLLATFLSANTILGYSGEVYGFGSGLVWIIPGTTVAILFASEMILPVLHPLKLVSPNQYLEMRFKSPALRRIVVAMTLCSIIVYMGLALYAPTLALAAVTPLKWSTHVWIMGIVVTIYASFGGLKAVVWADVCQMTMMVAGVLLITIMSGIEAGGFQRAWEIADKAGRTNAFNTDLDPRARHTVWNVLLLSIVSWGSHYSISQANYQRISSVSTVKQAKRVLYYNIIGMAFFLVVVFMMGLFIFAVYDGCDPLEQGFIKKKDEIVVFYVKDKLSHLWGIPGIFVATLISAALSSLSSGVNTLATLVWGDVLAHLPCFKNSSDFVAATASKVTTVIIGAITIGMAFLASSMGGLVQAGYTVVGVMAGPVLGVYLLGMAVPFCKKTGALTGLLAGYGICVWIAVGGFIYQPIKADLLPFSADNCTLNTLASKVTTSALTSSALTSAINATLGTTSTVVTVYCDPTTDTNCVTETPQSLLMILYSISYTMYPFIGLVICLIVGITISLVIDYQQPKEVPGELVLVCLRRFTAKESDIDSDNTQPAKLTKTNTVETLVMEGVTINPDNTYKDITRF